jgi:hypothetical protein
MCGGAAQVSGRRLASTEPTQPAADLSQVASAVDVAVDFAKSVGADAGIADAAGKAALIAVDAAADTKQAVQALPVAQSAQPATPVAGRRALKAV